MGTVLIAALAGWLTMFSPPPDGSGTKAEAKKSHLSEDAQIERGEEIAKQGWALFQQGKPAEAVKKFEESVALDSESANSWNGLGWSRFNSGDGKSAIKAFEKCVTLEPNHPAALNGLGQVYLSQREYDKAEKFLLKAAPQAPAAWTTLWLHADDRLPRPPSRHRPATPKTAIASAGIASSCFSSHRLCRSLPHASNFCTTSP